MDTKTCLHAIDEWIYHVGLNPGDYPLGSIYNPLKHSLPYITTTFLYLSVKIVLCFCKSVCYQSTDKVSQGSKSNTQRRI